MNKIYIVTILVSFLSCLQTIVFASDVERLAGFKRKYDASQADKRNKQELNEQQQKTLYAQELGKQFEAKFLYSLAYYAYNKKVAANSDAIQKMLLSHSQKEVATQKAIFFKQEQQMLQEIIDKAFEHHQKAAHINETFKNLPRMHKESVEREVLTHRQKELEQMLPYKSTVYKKLAQESLYIFYERSCNK